MAPIMSRIAEDQIDAKVCAHVKAVKDKLKQEFEAKEAELKAEISSLHNQLRTQETAGSNNSPSGAAQAPQISESASPASNTPDPSGQEPFHRAELRLLDAKLKLYNNVQRDIKDLLEGLPGIKSVASEKLANKDESLRINQIAAVSISRLQKDNDEDEMKLGKSADKEKIQSHAKNIETLGITQQGIVLLAQRAFMEFTDGQHAKTCQYKDQKTKTYKCPACELEKAATKAKEESQQ